MKKITAFIFLMTLFTTSYSSETPLYLEEVIKRAHKHSFELKNSKLDSDNANYQIKKAYKSILPRVDYSLEGNKYETERAFNNQNSDIYYKNSFKVSQPIFQGGALIAGVVYTRENRKKYDLLYKDQEIRTTLDAIDKYIEVLIAKEELAVFSLSLKTLEEEYRKVNRKFQLDMIPKTDILPLETRILNLQTDVIQSENKIAIAKADLKNFIGLNYKDDINLSPLPSNEYNLSGINLDLDVGYIRNNSRFVKLKESETGLKESEKIIARSEFLPKVNAFYRQSSGDVNFSRSNDNYTWDAGISVDINIFQFGKSVDEYKIKRNEFEKAKNLENKMRNDVELELRRKYLELVKFQGIIKAQEAAVRSARENFSMERSRYQMDLVDSLSFIKVEENLVSSELNLLVAKYNFYLAFNQYKSLLK